MPKASPESVYENDGKSNDELRAFVLKELERHKDTEDKFSDLVSRVSSLEAESKHWATREFIYKFVIVIVITISAVVTAIFRVPWASIANFLSGTSGS